eukprot:791500-Pelagomonas_calceolata.AAC.5
MVGHQLSCVVAVCGVSAFPSCMQLELACRVCPYLVVFVQKCSCMKTNIVLVPWKKFTNLQTSTQPAHFQKVSKNVAAYSVSRIGAIVKPETVQGGGVTECIGIYRSQEEHSASQGATMAP